MANKALKGLTIKIGGDTSELLDSLKDVEKKGKDLSSELGQINKLLKLDPKNTELLAQKQKVLADAISNTEDRLDTLKAAEKQAQEQFKKGEISEQQYRALQREVIATESKLDKYKQAVKETTEAEKKLADASDDVGQEMDDQADKTRDADRAAEDLDDSAGGLARGGLAAMAAAATAAVTSIVALAESTREYRTEMAKLDTAFQNNGFSAEAATKTYEELQSVVGETGQAVEAANHIAALAKNEEDLAKWTEIATGVYARWGASLSIESLTEAANETLRVGQVTGALADSLNWAAAEGETYGVTMKKNIAFTKLSEKELAKLSKTQRAEYKAREEQYTAIEEWNKAVEEAASAEDYFNLALQQCSTEQERQQLITDTLTDLYGDAATQFKKTNKEVIESNKATEEWNKATAKLGKTVEPVMTDIKKLGVTLLKDMEKPLQNIATYIQTKVIPAIKNISKWVKNNMPAIKAGIVGITTAIVAYKVACIATTIAQKGFAGAIKSTTVAQKALNLVQSASPWGLIATGIAAATTAIVYYSSATNKALDPVELMTNEQKQLCDAVDASADAFREQQAATKEATDKVSGQMKYVSDLADELLELADASGKVKKQDEARAEVLVKELNKHLGTEYELTDGILKNYKDLEKTIYAVIEAKKAELLLEAAEGGYSDAITNVDTAWGNYSNLQHLYETQLAITEEARKAADEWRKEYTSAGWVKQYMMDYNTAALHEEQEAEALLEILEEKLEKAEDTYNGYRQTIDTYNAASSAVLQGNYEQAVDLLAKQGDAYKRYTDVVDEETAKVLADLEQRAYDAGRYAQTTKEQFEKGVAGYTQPMVDEAEAKYKEALGKFASAYSDALGLGKNFGQGVADGIKIKNGAVGAAAIAQIREAVKAAKKEAEIKSPSRVMRREVGAQLGEGNKLGIEDATPDVEQAAKNQMGAILDAYRAEEVNAQRALRHVAEQQSARQVNSQMAAAGSSAPLLEKILTAIEKGQVLTIDGNALVGATANSMDSALGRRRALAARGAI